MHVCWVDDSLCDNCGGSGGVREGDDCLRCGQNVAGLAHPHSCPGPVPFDWVTADMKKSE